MTTLENGESRRLNEPQSIEAEGYLVRGLRRLGEGLGPYVYEKTKDKRLISKNKNGVVTRDVYAILLVMVVVGRNWQRHFQDELGYSGHGLANELFEFRNGPWAHLIGYSDKDVIHYLGVIERLLKAISAHEQADQVAKYWEDIIELLYGEGRGLSSANSAMMAGPEEDEGEEKLEGHRGRRPKATASDEPDNDPREDSGAKYGGRLCRKP